MILNYTKWPWKVVIPSYNRADYIITATLKMCEDYQIPSELIYVFIVDTDEQREIYNKTLQIYLENGLHIVHGPLGLKNMRNFISAYFEDGQPLLSIDDDVIDLQILYEDDSVSDLSKAAHWKLRKLEASEFLEWTTETYKMMCNSLNKRDLFGIYPVKNGFFMKDLAAVTYDARFCVGAFWGIINSKQPELMLTVEEKEDMERSILFTLKDGGVLRHNRITLTTKYYKTPGGMQTHQNKEDRVRCSIESAKYLCEKYPTLCKLYYGKKNGMCEVRFKNKPQVIISGQ